jgi:hypothetical protein
VRLSLAIYRKKLFLLASYFVFAKEAFGFFFANNAGVAKKIQTH